MIFRIEQFLIHDYTIGKIEGEWHGVKAVNKSPIGVRDLCYQATRLTGIAHRIVNPYNDVVMATFKFNPPNKVVTTYNSSRFEDAVVSGAIDDRIGGEG